MVAPKERMALGPLRSSPASLLLLLHLFDSLSPTTAMQLFAV